MWPEVNLEHLHTQPWRKPLALQSGTQMLRIRRIWRNLRGYDALAFACQLTSYSPSHCGEGYATTAFRQVHAVSAVYTTGTHCHLIG